MRVAVCEDMQMFNRELLRIIGELAGEIGIPVETDMFLSYSQLSSAMKDRKYDLVLLETVLNGVSGIEFVRLMRQRHDETDVIFVTSYPENALYAYSVFPVGYVVKPVLKKKLRPFFRRAAKNITKQRHLVLCDKNGTRISALSDDIIYIEVIGSELTVHTREHNLKCGGSLTDALVKLGPGQFYRAHRSYIVNMNYVVRMSKYYFVMDNGDKVTIAKNRYAEAKEKLSVFAGV